MFCDLCTNKSIINVLAKFYCIIKYMYNLCTGLISDIDIDKTFYLQGPALQTINGLTLKKC